ncbi:MAG: UDP-3-O-(3-hydroxymyristoyl)glucosamine N-acyltransferase [Opitutaceae bacterium]|nr:UDP-3-O-(3-hydroxymyristoyl)glucosamine N-acyltransferase [Opitutaceae bacterium]
MQLAFTPDEIAAIVQPRAARGATAAVIRGISALGTARPGDLSFLGNPKYRSEVAGTRASLVLVPPDYTGEPAAGQLFLVVDQPSVALARLCARIEQMLRSPPAPGVHPSAVVAPDAQIATTAAIGPLCVIEADVRVGGRTCLQASVYAGRGTVIGDDCLLMPGVRLYPGTQLGHRVRLHANVVIGSDGFGYEQVNGRHEKVPQIGQVVIEDDVEIGAGSTVDRARFGRTIVGEGTKIDNLVQLGHNVVIGKHCILCAQTGISGSTTVGDCVVLGGQVGVGGHITIGKGVKAGGQTGIAADVPAGTYINGTPALPYMLERRLAVLHQRLPELFHRLDALEAQVKKSTAAK